MHVSCGSKADVAAEICDVRFAPESRLKVVIAARRLTAKAAKERNPRNPLVEGGGFFVGGRSQTIARRRHARADCLPNFENGADKYDDRQLRRFFFDGRIPVA
jgi:hypothetical protein